MNLNESISRMRSLMYEDVQNYKIETHGDIDSLYGMNVCIMSLDGEHIGETKIIDFTNGLILSPNLTNFTKDNDTIFDQSNCVYQHGLNINQTHQRQGYGEKLKKECHNIIKNLGIKYVTNIVSIDNIGSQKLMNKLGYQKLKSNGEKDLLYLKI